MTKKIAVSLPDDLVEQAHRAVEAGKASSVSAYVASAMRSHGRSESLRDVLDDVFEEISHPDAQRRTWARRALGLPE